MVKLKWKKTGWRRGEVAGAGGLALRVYQFENKWRWYVSGMDQAYRASDLAAAKWAAEAKARLLLKQALKELGEE